MAQIRIKRIAHSIARVQILLTLRAFPSGQCSSCTMNFKRQSDRTSLFASDPRQMAVTFVETWKLSSLFKIQRLPFFVWHSNKSCATRTNIYSVLNAWFAIRHVSSCNYYAPPRLTENLVLNSHFTSYSNSCSHDASAPHSFVQLQSCATGDPRPDFRDTQLLTN